MKNLNKEKVEVKTFENYGERGGSKPTPEVTYNNKKVSPEIIYKEVAKSFHSCMRRESDRILKEDPSKFR